MVATCSSYIAKKQALGGEQELQVNSVAAAGLWCDFGQASPMSYEGWGGSVPRTLRVLTFSLLGGEAGLRVC